MSSNTLSAVIEKMIRRLCLNDFPCGFGSWRTAKECTERAETVETDALLDLLSCPHSPWRHDESWSPQAPTLRRTAVISPKRLHTDFIYNYFTALRIIDKGVSVIDDGLVKFAKLEELVLSGNKLTEIPAECLPCTLKILELRDNWISSLSSLTTCPPPRLQYLGLCSNSLGSYEDAAHLTGRHWPQLVCLDLSDCEFQDHRVLLDALSTLSCLRTLMLEGNPFTLSPSYPGFTVDSLPQLSCLDTSWISPEERQRFRGLAKMTDVIEGRALATVRVGRMRGIPDLLNLDENTTDFPVVTYSYFVKYEFPSHQTLVKQAAQNSDSECKIEAGAAPLATEDESSDAELKSNHERESKKPHAQTWTGNTDDTCCGFAHVSRHSTSKLMWTECMDFSDAQTYTVDDLGSLKSFLNRGMSLRIEEEKVLSWPAAPEDALLVKPSRNVKETKGGKGKDAPVKSGSTKDKTKDKKKKSIPELVQDAPIRRTVGSVRVPLQSLVGGGQKVDILCDFGVLYAQPGVEATQTPEKAGLRTKKDLGKKIKEEKKKEDRDSKQRGGSSAKRTAAPEGKGGKEPAPNQPEPVTVELSVELERWQTASEARPLLLPRENC